MNHHGQGVDQSNATLFGDLDQPSRCARAPEIAPDHLVALQAEGGGPCTTRQKPSSATSRSRSDCWSKSPRGVVPVNRGNVRPFDSWPNAVPTISLRLLAGSEFIAERCTGGVHSKMP